MRLGTWGLGLKRPRLILLIVAVVLITTAVVLAVSGGFRTTVGGFRISAQSPLAASIAALIAGAAWIALARRHRAIGSDLEAAWLTIERNASRLIGVIALIAAIVASAFATRSAAGADASGYLSQAQTIAITGLLPPIYFDEVGQYVPQNAGWITTPLGWRPFDDDTDVEFVGIQVPTYPPGLPLLMSVPHAIAGIEGANAIVIASAAIAVWATGMLAGGISGVVAAVLLAMSPVFLYQSLQPMSDVPVTAAWMLCFLLLGIDKPKGLSPQVFAGIACALAVLIRPNLAPLAVVPLLMARNRIVFAAPVAVAGVFLALLQWSLYGSAFRSGYGRADELFSIANAAPNLQRYFSWLIATSPVLLLAPFGIARLPDRRARAVAAFASLVVLAYLIYAVFDHWSYLRFLLPALALFAVFTAGQLVAWIERSPAPWRAPLLLTLTLGITAYSLFVARSLDTFKLVDQLRRVEQVADFIGGYSAENPVVISGEQSGAIRYYTRDPILRWEAATPDHMRAAITGVQGAGHSIYIALDAWEQEPFMKKFASIPELLLDWPPMLDAGTSHRTRLWRISDRARFLEGTQLPTVRLP